MNEPYGSPMPETPKKNNTMLIVAISLAVLCCCCAATLVIGWFYGDQIVQALGLQLY